MLADDHRNRHLADHRLPRKTGRCQLSARAARIEAEDLGGPWRPRPPGDRPHGLDIQALTSPDQWGTQATGTGGRIVWAQLTW
jgi:hypothetical protein